MYNQASIYKGCGVYNLGDGASTKLPANTLRFLFSKPDYDPTVAGVGSSGTWQKVDTAAANVWDWTKSGNSFLSAFDNAFNESDNLVSVIAAGDTSTIINMGSMFNGCTSLTSVPLFDTTSVLNMSSIFKGCSSLTSIPLFNTNLVANLYSMLHGCTSLTSVPLFDTNAATNVSYMVFGCTKVAGGALALYKQMSTQANPPANHTSTFTNCGRDTETGAAELAQIPSDWGGTAPASLNMGAPQNLTEPLSPSVIDGDDSLTN